MSEFGKFLKTLLIGAAVLIVLIIAPLGGVAVAVITVLIMLISWCADHIFGSKK